MHWGQKNKPKKKKNQKQYCNKFNKDFKKMVHINKKTDISCLFLVDIILGYAWKFGKR